MQVLKHILDLLQFNIVKAFFFGNLKLSSGPKTVKFYLNDLIK